MMKNKQEIERQVEQTLNSLNNLQAAEGNEYLYSKIINRMQYNRQETVKTNQLMLRLSLALALFVCVNGMSYYVLSSRASKSPNQSASGKSAFADTYQLNGNDYSY